MAEFFHDDPGDSDAQPQFLPSGFVAGMPSDAPMPEAGNAPPPASPGGAPSRGEYADRWSTEPAPEKPAEAPLPPRSCRLDDGRVVTLRLTNAFHDFKMAELWTREGITIPTDPLMNMVLKAVCALDRITTPGLPQPTEYMLPRTRADIEGRLQQFTTGQSMILAASYMEVEGLMVAGDQFRPGAVAREG